MKFKTLRNTEWRQWNRTLGTTAQRGETIKTCHNPTHQWKRGRVRTRTVHQLTQHRSRRGPHHLRTPIRRSLISTPHRSKWALRPYPRKQKELLQLQHRQPWKVHRKYANQQPEPRRTDLHRTLQSQTRSWQEEQGVNRSSSTSNAFKHLEER